jgi:hypothetical protein
MAEYPREELEEMMQRWLAANRRAEEEGNWSKHLGPFYTDDAVYRWNMGPNEEFCARGRKEIEEIALGYQMKGFEDWVYTYDDVLIDDKRGEIIGMWRQVAPYKRPDGTNYEAAGVGGSWFRYAGNFQWKWQRDFFDLGNTKALFFELAGAGKLNPVVREKIHTQARGVLLPGHERIRPQLGRIEKLRNTLAMVRIALFG